MRNSKLPALFAGFERLVSEPVPSRAVRRVRPPPPHNCPHTPSPSRRPDGENSRIKVQIVPVDSTVESVLGFRRSYQAESIARLPARCRVHIYCGVDREALSCCHVITLSGWPQDSYSDTIRFRASDREAWPVRGGRESFCACSASKLPSNNGSASTYRSSPTNDAPSKLRIAGICQWPSAKFSCWMSRHSRRADSASANFRRVVQSWGVAISLSFDSARQCSATSGRSQ